MGYRLRKDREYRITDEDGYEMFATYVGIRYMFLPEGMPPFYVGSERMLKMKFKEFKGGS